MIGAEEWLVIRVIATFAIIAAFAYVLNLPVTRRWQARVGISQLVVAGFPFIAMGMLARTETVGVLDDNLLSKLSPLLAIALAVIGMRIGLRVEVVHLLRTPRAVVTLASARFVIGGLVLFAAAAAALGGDFESMREPDVVRDASLLAIAGTVTSVTVARGLTGLLAIDDIPLAERATRLGELLSVGALLVLGAYVRPEPGVQQVAYLPAEIWLLTAIGLAVVLGTLCHLLLSDRAASGDDAPVIALGAVAVVAGVASFLGFSPLAIGVIVGVVLGQLAGAERERYEAAFDRYQRGIYGVLLFVLGALAMPLTWQSALVAGTFVIARFLSSVLATRVGLALGRKTLDAEAWRRLVIAPLGATAIAILIGAHELYPHANIAPAALALICAAFVTETGLHVRRESTS